MPIKRPDERLFDVRLRTRLLNNKLISKEEVDKFLAKLPDAEDNLEFSEVHLDPKTGLDL